MNNLNADLSDKIKKIQIANLNYEQKIVKF